LVPTLPGDVDDGVTPTSGNAMVERSTFCADSGGFGGLRRMMHSDLAGEMNWSDGSGNLAKVRVASSNLVIRSK
jgi:hypothetical protein